MIKRLCAYCAVLLILLQILPNASAETIIDMDKKGSISVKVVYEKVPLEGLKMNCIRVGELIPSGSAYYFECVYDRNVTFTSENIHDTDNPKEMLELVKKNNHVGVSKKVDKNGNLKFGDLTPGLYLIYQTENYSLAGSEYKISPFLVTIPYEGKYEVDAKSKPSLDIFPEEPTKPTEPTKPPKLPQTGQLRWPIPILASCGMACFILGWWLCFGRRKDSYEK